MEEGLDMESDQEDLDDIVIEEVYGKDDPSSGSEQDQRQWQQPQLIHDEDDNDDDDDDDNDDDYDDDDGDDHVKDDEGKGTSATSSEDEADSLKDEVIKEPDLPVIQLYQPQQQQQAQKKKKRKAESKINKKRKKEDDETTVQSTTTDELTKGFTSALHTLLAKHVEGDNPIMQSSQTDLSKLAKEEKEQKRKEIQQKQYKKLLVNKNHVVLTAQTDNWNLERMLKKNATERVVKIFNAVRIHQKQHEKDVEKISNPAKAESISKEKFLNLLKNMKSTEEEATPRSSRSRRQSSQEQSKVGWGVLSDDYMLGATLKDWKDDDNDADNEH